MPFSPCPEKSDSAAFFLASRTASAALASASDPAVKSYSMICSFVPKRLVAAVALKYPVVGTFWSAGIRELVFSGGLNAGLPPARGGGHVRPVGRGGRGVSWGVSKELTLGRNLSKPLSVEHGNARL